ncbi:MAG: MBL fold metallo-hydrolase, partial [Burkholderiaceae bacterium]|nr:MBL fold metallo-hydrolase [Burkholderiaceae bacterium]
MITIEPIAAFTDNYLWLLHDGHQAAIVDPGDAAAVEAELQRRGLRLAAILVTHHHPDHTGGVLELAARHRVPVHG